jgi:hypothetical protein
MSALKIAGVFGVIGGVGLIGYYLLNKYKPTISKKQKAELQGELYVLKDDKPEYRKIWSILAKYGYDNLSNGSRNSDYLPLINKLLTQNPLVISAWQKDILKDALKDVYSKNGVSREPTVFYSLIGEDLAKWLQDIRNQDRYKNFDFEKKNTVNLVEQNFTNLYRNKGIKCGIDPITRKDPCAYNYGVPFNKSVKGMPDDEYWKKMGNSGLNANERFKKEWFAENYVKYAVNEYVGFFKKLPDTSGVGIEILADDCAQLDRDIKRIQDRIVEQTKNQPNETHRRVLVWFKSILEDYFEFQGCRDTIEKQRYLDSAKSQTLFSIKAEDSVLGASQTNQNIYLGVGALVLVLSTGILLSAGKSSTPTTGSSKSSGILGNLVIVGGLAGMGYLIFKKPKVYKSEDEVTELLNTK